MLSHEVIDGSGMLSLIQRRKALANWAIGLVFATLLACDSEPTPNDNTELAIETVAHGTVHELVTPEGEQRLARIPSQTCHIPDPAIDEASAGRFLTVAPIVYEIHAGLFSLAQDGSNDVNQELAEAYVVSDEGSSYEFVLRNDLKFSDGSPLASADVKWSWERALKMSATKGRAIFALGSIAGANDVAAGKSDELTGFNLVDDRRFRVQLDASDAVFPLMLTDPVASIVKKENVEQWPVTWTNSSDRPVRAIRFETHQLPVGAGPFALDEFTSNRWDGKCVLVRNRHYWGAPPLLDVVEYMTDSNALSVDASGKRIWDIAFAEGTIDLVPLLHEQIGDARDQAEKGDIGFFGGFGPPTVAYLVFNPAVEPFDDLEFRRSLIAASDPNIFTPNERIPPAERLLTPNLVGADASAVTRLPFDLEMARAHIENSKYSNSYPIVYRSSDQGWFFETLGKMFDAWEDALGIRVVRSLDDGSVSDQLHSMRFVMFSPALPDPTAVLLPIVDSFGRGDTEPVIVELRRMLERSISEPDAVARGKLYADAEQYALDQALVLPIANFESQFFFKVQPWVEGFRVPQYSGSVFHAMELDDSVPER